MIPRTRRPSDFLLEQARLVLAVLALGALATPAEAQWYPGTFWGNPFLPGPSSVDVINQAALDRIANASQAAPAYAESGYSRSMRDPEFFERYDYDTRRALEDRVARKPSTGSTPTKTAKAKSPSLAPPVLPIAGFYNRANQLVWPSDAPTLGELGMKRKTSDDACLLVKERVTQGAAVPVALVTDARAKLLDYGRPALDYLRKHSTSPIAETFHMFLLSLYESLGQSAKPRTPAGS